MKQLLTFNIQQCHTDYINCKTNRTPFNLNNYYNKRLFLNHCLTLFATIPLIRSDSGLISMTKTMQAIMSSTMHSTLNGDILTDSLSALIVFTAVANRSDLMSVAATKDPTLGGLTPLFMYAHKLYNNVEYSEWDQYDINIKYALGKFLGKSWEFVASYIPSEEIGYKLVDSKKVIAYSEPSWGDKKVKPILTPDRVNDIRKETMTYNSGKLSGTTAKTTSYKMSKYLIDEFMYPPHLLIMELQTWVANVELRKEDSMLLDLWNWGDTPIAWDAIVDKPTIAPVRIDNPWT